MQTQIREILNQSFEDYRFSPQEKIELSNVIKFISQAPDKLNFVRNQAFKIVAEHYRQNQTYYLESLKWLEEVIKVIDKLQNEKLVVQSAAYFSPGSECSHRVISLINSARDNIDVCVFTISDDKISQALQNAFKRQVKIRIITDNDKAEDLGSDVYALANSGVPVRIDRSPNHMHHKFAIFDNTRLVNGSFNWTRSASVYNQENIVVSDEPALIGQFNSAFEKLWTVCQTVQ